MTGTSGVESSLIRPASFYEQSCCKIYTAFTSPLPLCDEPLTCAALMRSITSLVLHAQTKATEANSFPSFNLYSHLGSSRPLHTPIHKGVKGLRRVRHPVCNGQESGHRGTSSMWLSVSPPDEVVEAPRPSS